MQKLQAKRIDMYQLTIFDLMENEPAEPFTVKYWDNLGYIHCEDIFIPVNRYLEAVKEWRKQNPDKHFISIEGY